MSTEVGLMVPSTWLHRSATERRDLLDTVAAAGIDHVAVGDHVSFYVGAGFDGLIQATALASAHDWLPVHTAVYLLPLRHPLTVARQLASFSEMAPARLVFGVGVGGEDRREVANCGVDPATRGRRIDETLEILRALATGRPVTHRGEFFELDEAWVEPAPDPPVPILVGGRSDAAVARASRHGDGWLGIWVSPDRFADVAATIAAAGGDRDDRPWRHELNVWCGLGPDTASARARVAAAMEALYQLPFGRFERYAPYGTPAEVAERLAPYVEAGCGSFNLIAPGGPEDETIAAVGEVAEHLHAVG
jgi:alkanesulfonate monooxygenase SsuD/methylene tetrahydromethanopterin reductase-like flavin-dependent oxidoreductase (luciferase family)